MARPRWPARCYSPNEDITCHAQLSDLLAQLVQLGALVRAQPLGLTRA